MYCNQGWPGPIASHACQKCLWQAFVSACSALHISYLEVPCIWDLQANTRVKPFICTMPMRLDEGWNQIQFNLADFTRRAYGGSLLFIHHPAQLPICSLTCSSVAILCGPDRHVFFAGTNYIETLRMQIHANCRIRRVYFSDRLYSEEELPPEFKLFLPAQK